MDLKAKPESGFAVFGKEQFMEWKIEKHQIRYEEGGKVLAEITFPYYIEEEKVYEFDHTFVDPSLRGQGIAGTLVEKAIAEVKGQGGKILPTCPYVKTWFARHKEEEGILYREH